MDDVTPLSTIFQLYRGDKFFWVGVKGKQEYQETNTAASSHAMTTLQ